MDGWPSGFRCLSTPMGLNLIPSEITATSQDLTPDGAVVGEASDKWPNIYGNRPKTHLILCIQVASRCVPLAPDCSRSQDARISPFFFGILKGRLTTHGPRKNSLTSISRGGVLRGSGYLG